MYALIAAITSLEFLLASHSFSCPDWLTNGSRGLSTYPSFADHGPMKIICPENLEFIDDVPRPPLLCSTAHLPFFEERHCLPVSFRGRNRDYLILVRVEWSIIRPANLLLDRQLQELARSFIVDAWKRAAWTTGYGHFG